MGAAVPEMPRLTSDSSTWLNRFAVEWLLEMINPALAVGGGVSWEVRQRATIGCLMWELYEWEVKQYM